MLTIAQKEEKGLSSLLRDFISLDKVWKFVARNALFFIMELLLKCMFFWWNEFLCIVMGKLVSLEKRIDSHLHYKPP